MKRKFIIVLVAQLFLIFIFLTYAFVQNAAAVKSRMEAEKNFHEAEKQRALADANAREAITQAELAREAREKYQKLLQEKCP